MKNYLDIALQYHAAGLRIIPFWKKEGQTAFPPGGWKQYLTSQTEEALRALFAAPADGVALLCTGGLEGVDIDVKHDKAGTIAEEYFAHVKTFEGGEALLQKCIIQKTKSAGYHIIYRAANVEGNQKLTRRKGSQEAVIETRGPGGLLFISPSPGYQVERGDFLQIPEITEEERDILILAARELDEREEAANVSQAPGAPVLNSSQESAGDDLRPGDDFNRQHDVLDVLEGYGWRVVKRHGGREYLNRPGNPEPNKVNASIVTTKTGERVFYPFTTATAFNSERCYSAFAVYAIEEHGGRFDDAARALRAKGYGSKRTSQATTREAAEPGPAKLYGMGESTPAALVLVQDRESAQAAQAAGLLGVVAIDGPALTSKQIAGAIAGGAKRFTLCFGNTPAALDLTRQTVEALLRYQEAEEAAFWVFVAQIPGGSLAALLGDGGGIEGAREAIAGAKSAASYFAEFFADVRAPEIAREHTGGRLDRDILRPHFKEEITALWRLLPTSETPYFEHLLNPVLEGYFLTWGEIKHDAKTLREREAEKRYRQEGAKISETAAALFREGKQEEAEETLRQIAQARSRAGAGKFAGLLDSQTEEALREHIRNAPPTLKTSYKLEVDGRSQALKLPAGGLSIFAARPGHGKSRMLVNLALDICQNHTGEVYYFTYEESRERVTLKALNAHLNSDFSGWLYNTNEEALEGYFRGEAEAIRKEAKDFEKDKTAFFDLIRERRLNILFSEMRAESLAEAIRYLHRQRNVSAVFVDYIQLLNLENIGRGINNRQEEVKAICNQLKDVARETGLPLILAAQFNREVKRAEALDLAALREAGDIEQTAALVVGMWNRYQDLENPAAEMEVKVLKNRGGSPNGRAVWGYDGNRYRVYPEATTSTSQGAGGDDGQTQTFKLKN